MFIYCKFHFMLFCPYFHVFSIVHIEKWVCCLVHLFIYLFYWCVIDGVCMLRTCFPFSLNGSTVGFYFLGRYLKTKCCTRKWDEHNVIHTFRLGNAVVSFTWRHFRFRCVQHMYLYIYICTPQPTVLETQVGKLLRNTGDLKCCLFFLKSIGTQPSHGICKTTPKAKRFLWLRVYP